MWDTKWILKYEFSISIDSLCGLVVRVPGYSPESDSLRYQIFWEVLGLERGPLSLVSTTEKLTVWHV
jgi:hypothetical protein